MNIVNVNNCQTLLLGRRGENEVTEVIFDFSDWAAEFGPGVIDLYAQRNGDAAAYPVLVTTDGTTATWIVTATDTNVPGVGRAEYVYRIDGKIAKSTVFQTCVMEDIGQPTSTPPDPYESWLEQLTALGAETEANAQAAEQSAENAAESAQEAAGSATSAEGYAGQAETAAGLAQAAQTASEAARDAAQTAQASAESSATAASGSAASAAGSATAAAGSASDASASASAAGASASAASASATTASNAATAAQAAQSAAEDAAEDAQQAAQQAHVEYEQLSGEVDDLSDEVAQQKSAIEDLQDLTDRKAGMLVDTSSGSIASFVPDSTIPDLLSVSVDIEPVQDLHGYDSPWPAGGSAQLLPTYTEDMTQNGITLKVNDDGSVTFNGTATATTVFGAPASSWQWDGVEDCWLSGCPAGGSFLNSYSLRIGALDSVSNYSKPDEGNGVRLSPVGGSADISNKAICFEIVIRSGTVCTNLTFKPMLNKGLSAQPFQPYENLCPISGWDSVEVERASDNLLSFDGREVYQSNFTPTTTVDFSRQYVFNGYASTGYRFNNQAPDDIVYAEDNSVAFTAKSAWYGIGWNVKISPGMTYTIARDNLVGGLHIAFYDKAGLYISRVTGASTFISPANAQYAIICLCNSTSGATSAQRVRLSFGTADKGWVQPVSTTYTIALGQTVYGAKLTIAEDGSVKALVDRAMVDMGTLTWNRTTSYSVPVLYANVAGKLKSNISMLCLAYKFIGNFSGAGGFANASKNASIGNCNANEQIFVRDDSYTDAAAFKAAMAGQQLVYELATPIEIDLDPVTISTISGQQNNVWADAGDVSVVFAADLKHYIDSKIAAAVAALS